MQFKGWSLKTKLGDLEVCGGVTYRNRKDIIREPVMSTGGHFQKKYVINKDIHSMKVPLIDKQNADTPLL